MKLVYIAGPYRAATGWGIELNIQRARAFGAVVVMAGAYPVIPHSNTSHFDGLAPDEFWLDGTMELLRRCDAAVFVTGWQDSSGARAEHSEALRLGLPCFERTEELCRWLVESRYDEPGKAPS